MTRMMARTRTPCRIACGSESVAFLPARRHEVVRESNLPPSSRHFPYKPGMMVAFDAQKGRAQKFATPASVQPPSDADDFGNAFSGSVLATKRCSTSGAAGSPLLSGTVQWFPSDRCLAVRRDVHWHATSHEQMPAGSMRQAHQGFRVPTPAWQIWLNFSLDVPDRSIMRGLRRVNLYGARDEIDATA